MLLGGHRCKHLQNEDISHQDMKIREGLKKQFNGEKYFIVSSNLRLGALPMQIFCQMFKIQILLSDLLPAIFLAIRNVLYRRTLQRGRVLSSGLFSHIRNACYGAGRRQAIDTPNRAACQICAGCRSQEGRHAAAVGPEHQAAVTQEYFLHSRLVQLLLLENSAFCKKSTFNIVNRPVV